MRLLDDPAPELSTALSPCQDERSVDIRSALEAEAGTAGMASNAGVHERRRSADAGVIWVGTHLEQPANACLIVCEDGKVQTMTAESLWPKLAEHPSLP